MPWTEISRETYDALLDAYKREFEVATQTITIGEPVKVITRLNNGEESFEDMRNLLCYHYDWLDDKHIYERWIDYVYTKDVLVRVRTSRASSIRPFTTDVKIGKQDV